jgi:hypothetical protein
MVRCQFRSNANDTTNFELLTSAIANYQKKRLNKCGAVGTGRALAKKRQMPFGQLPLVGLVNQTLNRDSHEFNEPPSNAAEISGK